MTDMLIMITGYIKSGKSTTSNILQKYGFVEKSFAKPLKEIGKILGFSEEQVNGTQEQKLEADEFWGISGRNFLQVFGSEVCRDHVPKVLPKMNMNGLTLWARLMERNILKNKRLVISDGRFPDEAELVKRYNGIIIRLHRNVEDSSSEVKSHKSETQIDEIIPDYIIDNNGTLEDLENKLLDILIKEGCYIKDCDASNTQLTTQVDSQLNTQLNTQVDSQVDSPDYTLGIMAVALCIAASVVGTVSSCYS